MSFEGCDKKRINLLRESIMKVGILTFHFAPNYGAVFQVLGMQAALQRLGHEPIFLNYRPEYMGRRYSPLKGWGLRSGRRVVSVFRSRLCELKRRKKFRRYIESNLSLSKPLANRDELIEMSNSCDAIVVGSDQVWNLNWYGEFDDTYFLGFLEEASQCLKVGYGACFGSRDQPLDIFSKAICHLQKFDAIGMRNDFGRQLLSEEGIVTSDVILDPAFLLNSNARKNSNSMFQQRVVVYSVDNITTPICRGIAKKAGEHLQLPVVEIRSEAQPARDEVIEIMDVDLGEWLSVMASARFLCVSSFHGCVFAIENMIPFVVVTEGAKTDRVLDLLSTFGLVDRLVSEIPEILDPFMAPLPESVAVALKERKRLSEAFLRNSLAVRS